MIEKGRETSDFIISAKDIERTYKLGEVEVKALRCIDLDVKKGEFLVILGPSGAGKTTLLNILGGIDTPTSGSVIVDHLNIEGYTEKQLSQFRRETVGWIFQFFNLIPSLTAIENVALSLEMARDTDKMMERSQEALALVGIADKANMFPSQLSGGEQQRVAIARALVRKPKIVLADEPTGNLDWETGQKIVNLLKTLNRREGITFIIVSHDISITQVADRVIHLRDGEITTKPIFQPTAKKVSEE
jgi:putative ABC transport system ATP-binding protein